MNENDIERVYEKLLIEIERIKENEAIINNNHYFGLDRKLLTYIRFLEQENRELKTLNKRYEEIISDDEENYKLLSSEIKQLGNQQKEFIEYITSYIELLNDKPDLVELSQKDILEEILSKYKEIIGGDNKC